MSANIFETNAGIGQREDLANFISMITRDETPFMSSIGKTKASAIFHEWQTDELDTPGIGSIAAEGLDTPTTLQGGDERSRIGNYTQINTKHLKVSGTRRAVDQAGVADEYAYQLKKRGTELRRDVEFSLVHAWQGSDGTGTRSFGGVQAAAANVIEAGSAATATFSTTFGTAPTGNTNANIDDLLLGDVDDAMQTVYENGGKATKLMLSPKNRREFSDKAHDDGGVRRNIDAGGSLRQSVDIYMSDFGDLMIMPNYVMGLDFETTDGTASTQVQDLCAIVYDPMWFNLATLRPLQEVDVGQKGDSTTGTMIEECTLEVRNPAGWALIVGIGGTP